MLQGQCGVIRLGLGCFVEVVLLGRAKRLPVGSDGLAFGTLVGGFCLLPAVFVGGLAFPGLAGFLPPLPLGFGDEAFGGGVVVLDGLHQVGGRFVDLVRLFLQQPVEAFDLGPDFLLGVLA